MRKRERERETLQTHLVSDKPMVGELGAPADADPVVFAILLSDKLLDCVQEQPVHGCLTLSQQLAAPRDRALFISLGAYIQPIVSAYI